MFSPYFFKIMKSYTDIEQSKKLAEILPIESADMYYYKDCVHAIMSAYHPNIVIPSFGVRNMPNYGEGDIPCWSLSALYDILPNNEKETTTLSRGGWKIEPVEYLDNWWCEYEDDSHTKDFTVSADNPVDACVEMIIKLHEYKYYYV